MTTSWVLNMCSFAHSLLLVCPNVGDSLVSFTVDHAPQTGHFIGFFAQPCCTSCRSEVGRVSLHRGVALLPTYPNHADTNRCSASA